MRSSVAVRAGRSRMVIRPVPWPPRRCRPPVWAGRTRQSRRRSPPYAASPRPPGRPPPPPPPPGWTPSPGDRKSTRLNSSHVKISYAVFCLKKKKKTKNQNIKKKKKKKNKKKNQKKKKK